MAPSPSPSPSRSPSSPPRPHRQPAPTPSDAPAQVACLAHLFADADAALTHNLAYQDALKEAVLRVDEVRTRARALKDLVTSLAASLAANGDVDPTSGSTSASTSAMGVHALPDKDVRLRAPGMLEPAVPYFRTFHGEDLPLNEDAKARERYLVAIQDRSWQAPERVKLKGEVVAHNHRLVAREALLR
ncbi:hypothetical protein JCM8208_004045, partial [Rhodotorula glutinis]